MTVTCPEGHRSEATDYCDTCGAPIGAAAAGAGTPSPAGGPALPGQSGAGGSVLDLDPAGPIPTVTCPHCGGVNLEDALFCEACGYDFTTGAAPLDDLPGDPAETEGAGEPEVPEPEEDRPEGNEPEGPEPEGPEPEENEQEGPEPEENEQEGAEADGESVPDTHTGTHPDTADADAELAGEVEAGSAGEMEAGSAGEMEAGSAADAGARPEGEAPPEAAPAATPPMTAEARPAHVRPRHTPPSRDLADVWVVEMWVDPDWYAVQQTDEACPSAGVPDIVVVRRNVVLVGRPSGSLGVRPDVDAGADSAVSRRHAQLTSDGTRWWIEDLGSSNGTFVGVVGEPLPTEPLAPGHRVEIDRDDRIYVGAWTRLVIRQATASEKAGQG
ncbi:FHA domain-containing protein [Ornithinimicrobium flavum]|uniref:FHA domain-containing protein n=1 Tax=Ornithinimicrobium flavum TaxID=1288636 RepID=UPI001EE9183B|nr:FHA domain-containing protein [Ornithinimicrobium flavum]